MKVIILAAGYGTRLYPLTINTPKALVPIAGKPMLQRILEKLLPVAELKDVYIVTNDKFYKDLVDWSTYFVSRFNIKIINDGTTSNEDRLGAVGDIVFAIEEEKIDDDLFILGSDNLSNDLDFRDVIRFYKEKNGAVNIVNDLKDLDKVKKLFGVVIIDEANKIIDFQEKPEEPKSALASGCYYLYPKHAIDQMKKCLAQGESFDNTGDLLQHIAKEHGAYAYVHEGEWFDIGSIETYKHVDKLYRERQIAGGVKETEHTTQ